MDETLSVQMDIYSLPQKIYISQLEGYNKEFLGKPNEWIKALYYYSVTRLGLNDIPYNYLIDKSGNIYEGARGGEGEGGENVSSSASPLEPLQVVEKKGADVVVTVLFEGLLFPLDDPFAEGGVVPESLDQPADPLRVLALDQEAATVHRLGHRRGVVGDHGNLVMKSL